MVADRDIRDITDMNRITLGFDFAFVIGITDFTEYGLLVELYRFRYLYLIRLSLGQNTFSSKLLMVFVLLHQRV